MKKSDKMRDLLKSMKSQKMEPKEEVKKEVKEEAPEEMEKADLNEDGVVDEKDLEIVKKSIRKKKN